MMSIISVGFLSTFTISSLITSSPMSSFIEIWSSPPLSPIKENSNFLPFSFVSSRYKISFTPSKLDIFSSNSNVGETWPSPYTKKSIDSVLASTKSNLNEWVTVRANVKEDFKKFHDLDVEELSGIAIMADTDNSKLTAVSYYQNIFFSSE